MPAVTLASYLRYRRPIRFEPAACTRRQLGRGPMDERWESRACNQRFPALSPTRHRTIFGFRAPTMLCCSGASYSPKGNLETSSLQPETRRVLDEAVSGPLGIKLLNPVTGRTTEHRWDREHQEYNQAIGELFKMYLDGLGAHGITPELMTPAHAREFVKAIHQSQDPRISNYLAMIRLRRSLRLLRGNE